MNCAASRAETATETRYCGKIRLTGYVESTGVIGDGNEYPTIMPAILEVEINNDLDIPQHNQDERPSTTTA